MESAAAFERQIHRNLEEVTAKAKQSQSELDKLAQLIQQHETRLAEAKNAIEQQKGRLDQAITNYQQQFSTAEAKRASDFASATQKQTEAAATTLDAQRKEFSALLTAHIGQFGIKYRCSEKTIR